MGTSYPSGLGVDTLRWLREAVKDMDLLREQVTALRVVDPASTPTAEDIEHLKEFADVSGRQLDEWYVLLDRTQGDPGLMLQAGVIEDASESPRDSLFAEWGYVVDLDAGLFEVYRGFQVQPHGLGRFADRPPVDRSPVLGISYYPVALQLGWRLSELPSEICFLGAPEGAS